jgi:23S rRNA pseudouridine2457 synthase
LLFQKQLQFISPTKHELCMMRSQEPKYLYFKFFKPFGMLSQFTDEDGNPGLKRILSLPKDVYPVGRLDKDSEGLLLLTNDNRLKHKLLDPETASQRTYFVQVDGEITPQAVAQLQNPMTLNYKGKHHRTLPARVAAINPPDVPEREPAIRYRKDKPTSWISISIGEGKNRQVRKMTAQTGFPTLRLIRVAHGEIALGEMQPAELLALTTKEVNDLLKSL